MFLRMEIAGDFCIFDGHGCSVKKERTFENVNELGKNMHPAPRGIRVGEVELKWQWPTGVIRTGSTVEIGIGRNVYRDDGKGMPDGVHDA